ncbi:hypothetical protein HPB50_022000 [Hyalomma asiaticum]|uniref:Uncharacterized protein n=1 Tax=Hyalomma asiaticum TaxID=266040 RepID=A0ACB7SAH0_HYAAI|nr:hypothetical protein HPB50_022000 [Hyalomma asiaticum]
MSSNQQGLSEESDTLSLSEMPSKSFDINTADMTISSIHSTMKHEKASRLSLRNSQQRHSTPTFSHTAYQGAEVTPSNVSSSQNQSEKSTPSTPDTASPPQLVGSDFDGF